MNLTEPIINTALQGTAAKEFIPAGFPKKLQKAFHDICEKVNDTESAFYQMSALTFAFYRAGTKPQTHKDIISLPEAPTDKTPYIKPEAGKLLVSLHNNQNGNLLRYAYRKVASCNRLIPPLYL